MDKVSEIKEMLIVVEKSERAAIKRIAGYCHFELESIILDLESQKGYQIRAKKRVIRLFNYVRKIIRDIDKDAKGTSCEVCGSINNLHLHHKGYGSKRKIFTLCKIHHNKILKSRVPAILNNRKINRILNYKKKSKFY